MKFIITIFSLFIFGFCSAEIPQSVNQEIVNTIKYEKLKADPYQLRILKQKLFEQQAKNYTKPNSIRGVNATISGTVLNSTNSPIENHTVSLKIFDALNNNWLSSASTTTNISGIYSFTALASGTYAVLIGNKTDDYIDYAWNVTTNSQQVCSECVLDTVNNGIVISTPDPVSNINFNAVLGGVIQGAITDRDSGLGVDSFYLTFISATGTPFYRLTSEIVDAATGTYIVKGIPDDTYKVYLSPQFGNQHIPEVYGGPQCNVCNTLVQDGVGTDLVIAGGNTLSAIDWTPQVGASISGFLVDQLDLQAHYDYGLIMVFNELNYNVAYIIVYGNMADPLNDGSYTVGGLLAGSYYVQGGDLGRQFYQRELFESVPCPWSGCNRGNGTPIVLAHQQNLLGTNIQLNKGGKIEGFITDSISGNGLSTIDSALQYVQVYNAAGEVAGGGTITDAATGAYILRRAIAPGNYTLRTGSMFSGDFNEPYIEELYPNIACPGINCDLTSAGPGTPITVAESISTTGINIGLSVGNSFDGLITDLGAGLPVADVQVLAYANTTPPEFAAWTTTDAGGNFTISGLPNGSYYLLTNNGSNLPFFSRSTAPSAGWIDILYNGIACPGGSCDFTIGDLITLPLVIRGTPNIQITLDQGATIAGKITDFKLNIPISDIIVNVYNNSGTYISSQSTNAFGEYKTSGLPAGTYYLTTSSMDVLVDVIFGGGYCFENNCNPLSGTPIIVTKQQVATEFNMVLRPDFVYAGGFE